MMAGYDNDLELLDRVLLRLGSSDTDDKLEKSINNFLCPVLLKFGSANADVRNKVMEVLTHIQKRVKTTPGIFLPAENLIQQFGDKEVSPVVLNFTIIFLDIAFARLSTEKQLELLPGVVEILPNTHANHVYTLLRLVVPLLPKIHIPTDPKVRCEMLRLHERPATRKILSQFLEDVLLCDNRTALDYKKSHTPATPAAPQANQSALPTAAPKAYLPPPGLSVRAVEQCTDKGLVAITTELKCGVVDFIASGAFPSNEVVLLLHIACGDTHHSVATKAETALKRMAEVNYEEAALVTSMYNLLQGYMTPSPAKAGTKAPAPLAVALRRTALVGKVKEKVMAALLKSTRACNVFPQVVQVIFDALFGAHSNGRIRLLGLRLMEGVCDKANDNMIKAMGPVLLKGLLQILKNLAATEKSAVAGGMVAAAPGGSTNGQDKSENQSYNPNFSPETPKMQALAYLTIGKLAKRQPPLFAKDTQVLKLLINTLQAQTNKQQNEARLSIIEAVQMVTSAYDPVTMTTNVEKDLDTLLSKALLSEQGNVRLVAVQSARTIFPMSHVGSRYICMIGAGDTQDDVRECARAGLRAATVHEIPQLGAKAKAGQPVVKSPAANRGPAKESFPDFVELLRYTCAQAVSRFSDSELRYQTAMGQMPFSPAVYRSVLLFMRIVLAAQVDHPYTQDSHSSNRHTDTDAIEQFTAEESEDAINSRTQAISKYLSEHHQGKSVPEDVSESVETSALRSLKSPDAITCYIGLAECAWSRAGNAQLYTAAAGCLEELSLGLPNHFSSIYSTRVDWLLQFTTSSDWVLRRRVCTVLAVVVSLSDECDSVVAIIKRLRETSAEVRDERQRDKALGAITALSCIVGRHGLMTSQGEKSGCHDDEKVIGAMRECVTLITSFLDLKGEPLMCTLEAIGSMSRHGPLPIESGDVKDCNNEDWSARFSSLKRVKTASGDASAPPVSHTTKCELIGFLIHTLDKARDAKAIDALILAVGLVGYGDPTLPKEAVDKILETLYSKEREKSPDLHFTVGMSLARIAHASTVVANQNASINSSRLPAIVEKVLVNSRSAVPPVRQSSAIWLLHVVKLNAKNKYITHEAVSEIQQAFVGYLGDGDEFTQECASNGLGLVYECGDGSLKESLVTTLVSTLSDGQKRSTKLSGDTPVFMDGNMGNTPDGKQLGTYKDLCNLVSELNKPDLIYRFMALSNNNALWQSRKGAAFGFASIASIAGEQLDPYLPQLVPKLYRYKHDPNVKTRTAMGQIWKSLNLEGIDTIKKYSTEIFADLDINIIHKEWRNREASCLAMSDLISTLQTDLTNDQFEQTWLLCVRVLDDIKESVRQAAAILSKAVVGITAKKCDPSITANKDRCREAMAVAVPLLLTKGLQGNVKEVQALSLITLQKIARASGDLILPYATACVVTLLQQQSELESRSMNYLSFHIDKYDISTEKFEDMRMAASKLSPMAETIDLVQKSIDNTILDELIPRLLELVKGIGLQTRVGAAALLATLCEPRRELDTAKYLPRICKVLVTGLWDTSPAVRKGFGTTLSYILQSTKDKTSERCIDSFRTKLLDFENVDTAQRLSLAFTFKEIGRHAPTHFQRFAGSYLPLAYLGCHSDGKDEIEAWTTVWDENTPGTRAGLRLYQDELLSIVLDMLASSSWQQKRMAARTAADTLNNIGPSLKEKLATDLQAALLGALSGRVWDGKEQILLALGCLCKSRKDLITSEVYDNIISLLLKEAGRKTIKYKINAIEALADVLKADAKCNRYADLCETLINLSLYTDEAQIDANTTDSVTHSEVEKEKRQSSKETTKVRLAAYKAICAAWLPDRPTQTQFADSLATHLVSNAGLNVWSIKITIMKCLTSVLYRLPLRVLSEGTLDRVLGTISEAVADGKYSQLRVAALKALTVLLGVCSTKASTPTPAADTAMDTGTNTGTVASAGSKSATGGVGAVNVDLISVDTGAVVESEASDVLGRERLMSIVTSLRDRKMDGDPDVRRFSEALLPLVTAALQ